MLAIAPLGFLLVGSLVRPVASDGQRAAAGVGVAVTLTVVAVILAAGVAAASRWVPSDLSRTSLAACGALAAGGAAFAVGRLAVPSSLVTPWAVVVAALWGALVWRVHGRHEPDLATVLASVPERDRVVSRTRSEDLVPCDDATWQVRISSTRMRGLAAFALVAFGAVCWMSWEVLPRWWVASVAVGGALFAAVMLAWSSFVVRVDHSGLQVRSLTPPVVLVRVRPEALLGAGCAEIDPMDWGGWGLRWSARYTAFVVRGGPGLVVHRRSGRPLALEVPDGEQTADEGAALLRRVARRASGP